MIGCAIIAVVCYIAAIWLGNLEVKPSLVGTRDFWTWILIIFGSLNFIGFCIYGI